MDIDVDHDGTFVEQHRSDRGGTGAHNYAKFYQKWVRNNFRSNEEGREVGEHVDFIMIICPGQSKSVVHRKVRDDDKKAYPQQWADYKNGRDQRINGTPIDVLPGLPQGRIDSLKSLYIYSIEQLASLSDDGKQKVGIGANDLVASAKAYLSSKNKAQVQLEEELAKRDEEIKSLRETIDGMKSQIETLAAPKRRGRPPKPYPKVEAR